MIIIYYNINMFLKKKKKKLKEFYSKIDNNNKQNNNSGKRLESIKTALYIFTYIDEDKEEYIKIINDVEIVKGKYNYKKLIENEEN